MSLLTSHVESKRISSAPEGRERNKSRIKSGDRNQETVSKDVCQRQWLLWSERNVYYMLIDLGEQQHPKIPEGELVWLWVAAAAPGSSGHNMALRDSEDVQGDPHCLLLKALKQKEMINNCQGSMKGQGAEDKQMEGNYV